MKPISNGRMRRAVQVVFATGVAAGAAQAGAGVDSWLKIPGLQGESVVADHKGEIDVISFAQNLDAKTCSYAIVKNLDSASPGLADATARKSVYPNVTLAARKAGEGQKDFLTITLLNVTVQSLDLAGGTSADPREQVVFAPRSVNVTYRVQDAKGGLGAAVTSSFNCDK